MQILNWASLDKEQQQTLLQRPALQTSATIAGVQKIIDAVRARGDEALREFTAQFDGITLSELQVARTVIDSAQDAISDKTKQAIATAVQHIRTFHQAQLTTAPIAVETLPGVRCERHTRPIGRVGFYVPGGLAPLPSTVLMLAIPAQLAGCPLRVLCTPPDKNGSVNPHILYAASLCGIDTVYCLGGAQAIAAMAFGSQSVEKVDKIFGPGNSWVTLAKVLVAQSADGAQYDMPAGPSELMVIGDQHSNPTFIAADLLSQAEHGPDSQVICIATNHDILVRINSEVTRLLALCTRKAIAQSALAHSLCLHVDSIEMACAVANQYAPEHLSLQCADARQYLPLIKCAGSVFLGPWTPETAGDYASGTNHVLPTYGYARSCSGLGVADFTINLSVQELTHAGLKQIADTLTTLADCEGLDAHGRAVTVRMKAGVHEQAD